MVDSELCIISPPSNRAVLRKLAYGSGKLVPRVTTVPRVAGNFARCTLREDYQAVQERLIRMEAVYNRVGTHSAHMLTVLLK